MKAAQSTLLFNMFYCSFRELVNYILSLMDGPLVQPLVDASSLSTHVSIKQHGLESTTKPALSYLTAHTASLVAYTG